MRVPFTRKSMVVLAAALAVVSSISSAAQGAPASAVSADSNRLFVGVNYQPVDRTPEQIHRDIALMKKAGFTVVRMGDLSWDYFEPAEGVFDFKPFDAVLAEMQANGIKVILDIPGLPAPLWVHQKYPAVDLVADDGARRQPAERYMDDISDPDYRRLARGLAEALMGRYGKNPAVVAIGYDNEIGNGFMSWSEADRQRFIAWLKARYGDLPSLNKAWATQRWSRRISDWGQVFLPYVGGPGAPEPYLDLHRFWSEVTIAALEDLEAAREKNAPDKPAISNLWDSSERKGFDYLSTYRKYASHGAFGYYAGDVLSGAFETAMMKGGMATPVWFNEFTAGGGGYYGTPGRSRMLAHFGLLNGGQAVLAWTFNSHRGGEEQALFGLVDHDNTPSWKLEEWATIAGEFRKLEKLGFPRKLDPKVAIAYSFEARTASSPPNPTSTVRQYISTPYMEQEHNAFAPLFNDNVDVAVINIGHEDLSRYQLVVVPGLYLLDERSAEALRHFVSEGGTVIMTAFSAKVNENSQWFDTPLPGGLSDVFGVKTNAFYRTDAPLAGTVMGEPIASSSKFYEVLEPSTAQVIGRLSVTGSPPAATLNRFGKGQAIYLATPADPALLQQLYRGLYGRLRITRGPKTPEGVYARVVDDRTLYVNTTNEPKDIALDGTHSGVLSGRTWKGALHLEGFGVELVQ